MPELQHVVNKSDIIVRQALGLLVPRLVLGRLIGRQPFEQFKGRRGDTITIDVAPRAEAREYAFRNTNRDAIVTDVMQAEQITVTFDKMPYHAARITDEQATLDITDFGREISTPQADALARKIEGYIATALDAADLSAADIEIGGDDDPWDDLFVPARRALNDSFVDGDQRVLVVGADVEDWLLTKDESFRDASKQGGDALDMLHNAIIGRKAGFTVVGQMNGVIPDDAAYAFHPSAFWYVNGAPVAPKGAVASATATHEGYTFRQIFDYDADHLTDRSVLVAFAGVTSVEDERELEMASDGSFPLTGKNCRAVRIDFGAS